MSTIYIDGQAVAVEDMDLPTILAVLPYADGRLVEMTPSGPHLEATLATDLGTIAAAKMAGFEVWDDVLLGTVGAADGPTTITKHYGPGPHPGTGTPQTVHGTGGESGEDIRPGIDDNPTFIALAKKLHTQAAAVEPEITALFHSIADQTGGSLAGLDFRVKSERSIRDKIFRDLRIAQEMGRSTTAEEIALNIRDLNRYALTWPPDDQWVGRHETALQLLQDDGWTIYDDKYKGAWKAGDYYDGSNVHLHKGDTFVELQFHSPESWTIKEESDVFYNEVRVLPVDHPKRDRLLDKIYSLWNSDRSHVPPGAEALGSASFMMKSAATHYVFHDPEGVPVCPISVYHSQVHAWIDGAWVLLSITPAEVSESPDYKLSPASIVKHYGPGKHPGTGTEQTVHGASLLSPMQGAAKVKGVDTQAFLVNPDGSFPHVTMEGLESMTQLKGDKTSTPSGAETIVARIKDTMAAYGMTAESMDSNLQTVIDSAMARYADHPELLEEDKFYEIWHAELSRIAEKYDQGYGDVVAAAATISPGLNADLNLMHAEELAAYVSDNHEFKGKEAAALATQLQGQAYLIRHPVYTEQHLDVQRGLVEIGTPRPPETSPSRLAVAAELDKAATALRSGPQNLLDLPPEAAARAVHYLRHKEKGAGFNVSKGYTNYAQALQVLGDDSIGPNEVLLGIKTRSFYNNILDPNDSSGRGDVTVDFHTINYAAMGLGADKNTHIQGTPSLGGVHLGLRPAVADAVRRTATYTEERHGMALAPSRIQEILWAEWRRGLTRDTPIWTAYDGTTYPLKDISKKASS